MNTIETEDLRSPDDLINVALSNHDDDTYDSPYWKAVRDLRRQPTAEVFEAAKGLCQSRCLMEQKLGCNILAQLGAPEMPFATASFPLVLSVHQSAENLDTRCSAIAALGWLGDPRAVSVILADEVHPDADVRFWVTHAFSYLYHDPRCIEALIRLSNDSSTEVRDWSTFSLGSIVDQDSPEIRDALLARVDDPDRTTRCEAMVGLSLRKDPRVLDALIRELSSDVWCNLIFEAAENLGDSRCLPPLFRIKDALGDECVDAAIKACSPDNKSEPSIPTRQ